MSDYTDLPDWVWDLLAALDKYREEHPMLYRESRRGGYESTECFDGIAERIVPGDVRAVSRIIAARLQREANR